MRRFVIAALAAPAVAFGAPAGAQAPCPMTYEFFEFAVPHLDLEACPKEIARKEAFCRASVGHDGAHVFVFSGEGERCLLATKTYPAGQFEFAIK